MAARPTRKHTRIRAEAQALMIALYIALDSFGTACNVTGDGAIALLWIKFLKVGIICHLC